MRINKKINVLVAFIWS